MDACGKCVMFEEKIKDDGCGLKEREENEAERWLGGGGVDRSEGKKMSWDPPARDFLTLMYPIQPPPTL